MSGPSQQSSALVDANRRRTLRVLVGSAVLVVLGLAWAAVAGRDRPSPPELAAAEFVVALESGDCHVAEALVIDVERAGRPARPCDGMRPPGRPRVTRSEVALSTTDAAVVLIEVSDGREVVPTWHAVGVAHERREGRWRVARVHVACTSPAGWHAPRSCDRWEWP